MFLSFIFISGLSIDENMCRLHLSLLGGRGRKRAVGVPGIGPGLLAPQASVLPLYYTPCLGKFVGGTK